MRASLLLTLSSTMIVAVAAIAAGCASASEPPLGGPYGGTAGAVGATRSSTSPTDPAAADPVTDTIPAQDGGVHTGTSGSPGTSGTSGSPGTSGTSGSPGTSGTSGSPGTSGSSSGTTPPTATWTTIYTSYLASGTPGNCAMSGCHSQMGSKSAGYTWLKGRGYITANNAPLADPAQSCLSWLGGNMPPSGSSSNAAAASDLTAWAAAGAQND